MAAGRDIDNLIKHGYGYTGTDISEGMLNIVKKRYPKQEFYKQSVYDLSFPKKFDGFWAVAVLLHIPKSRIDEALQAIKAVMNKKMYFDLSLKFD